MNLKRNIFFWYRCETAGLFMECQQQEATKNGVDPMTMAKIIHRAYFDLPGPAEHVLPKSNGYFLFNLPGADWWPK